MKTLRYTGASDVRTIGPGDADGLNKKDVSWDASNHKEAEVTNDVAAWLLDNHSSEFVDVDAPEAPSDDSGTPV